MAVDGGRQCAFKRFNCQGVAVGPTSQPTILCGSLRNSSSATGPGCQSPGCLSSQPVLLWPQAAQPRCWLAFASITGIYNIYFNIARFLAVTQWATPCTLQPPQSPALRP
ncbi:hypothetical protein ACLKA7_009680 [Drosophila subpalustris]